MAWFSLTETRTGFEIHSDTLGARRAQSSWQEAIYVQMFLQRNLVIRPGVAWNTTLAHHHCV